MAVEDWIRMRTGLYSDPKVIVMSHILMDHDGPLGRYVNQNCQCDMAVTENVMRNVVVGALVTVWGISRHRGKREGDDLILPFMYLDVIDSMANIPGFGEAMSIAGWVMDGEDHLIFPNFFAVYNSPADEPTRTMTNAERQKNYRERRKSGRNETLQRVTTSNAREEKSREENVSSLPLPLSLHESGSSDSLDGNHGPDIYENLTVGILRDRDKLREWFLWQASLPQVAVSSAHEDSWLWCCHAAVQALAGRDPLEYFPVLFVKEGRRRGRKRLEAEYAFRAKEFAKGAA